MHLPRSSGRKRERTHASKLIETIQVTHANNNNKSGSLRAQNRAGQGANTLSKLSE